MLNDRSTSVIDMGACRLLTVMHGGKTIHIAGRFLLEDATLIKKAARLRRETVTVFLRRAVLRELIRLGARQNSEVICNG